MKARIATALAIVALSLSGISAATAQQPSETTAASETTTTTTITADPNATMPALDSPTITASSEPQPATTEPQPEPATASPTTEPQPTPQPVTSAPATVDPAPVTVDPTIPSETWNTSGIPLETWKSVQGTAVTPEPTPTESAPTAAPQQPICQEDQPCWNCETMGNKVCGAAAGETTDDFLTRVCAGPKLGDAYAGIMRNCYWQEATAMAPANSYLSSGFQPDPAATYWFPSQRYAGIIHSFND